MGPPRLYFHGLTSFKHNSNQKMDPFGPPPPIPAVFPKISAIPPMSGIPLDPATLKRALNERFLLSRRVEREGVRRIFIACMLFVAVKFVRHKFVGKREDTSF